MKLLELFTSSVPYVINHDDETKLKATATIGGRPIIVWIQKVKSGTRTGVWELDFAEEKKDGTPTTYATGSGSAAKVFSFVMEMAKLLAKKHDDFKGLYFIASGKSRCDLYTALVKRYTPAGYEHKIVMHGSDGASYTIFKA